MTTVDSKGRIVLPKDVRERLGLTAGSEVDVREEDGRAVVEPEDDPDRIIERMEELLADAPTDRQPTPYDELDPQSRDHVDTIHQAATQADETADGDE